MKYMLFAVAMLFGSVTLASESITLSPELQAQIVKEVSSKAPQTSDTEKMVNKVIDTVNTPGVMDKFVDYSEKAAEGVIKFTTKLGVAAGDFISSAAGAVMIAGIILWFTGKSLVVLVLLVTYAIIANYRVQRYIHGRYASVEVVGTKVVGSKIWGRKEIPVTRDTYETDGNDVIAIVIIYVLTNIPTLVLLIEFL